ncbi:MAG: family 20 glycosylhydrolase, partial [Faecalibacillus sp.]
FSSPIEYRYVKLTVDSLISGAYPSVSIYEIKIIGTKAMHNIAPEAKVTGESEAASVDVKYINDDNMDTRWGSTYGNGVKEVLFQFDEMKTIKSFILEWERKTAKDYQIDALIDGNWQTVVHHTKQPKNFQEIINLDTEIQTDQLKLKINSFLSSGADREGKVIDYPTVSLYEVIMYGEDYLLPPRDPATTVQDIANEVTVKSLTSESTELEMPEVPDGYTIAFTGADYEQVIARDRKIIKPIVDTQVVVNFEVTDNETNETVFTPDITVKVPGIYNKSESVNTKPTVLPELQQWYGLSGTFEVTDATKIVVDPAAKDFMKAAEALSEDYQDIMGKKLEIESGTNAKKGDFYFTLANEKLDKETYYLDIQDVCTIKADQYTGSYWATRSILQILKQTKGTINKGITKDYPKFELRGMMLDVARLPVDMYFLQTLVKTMSWYKMNDFQVHLNDNVFSIGEDGAPLYSGFRLESNVENLTNTDVYYSKDEFRDFINHSKELGVNIVPEFDSPGHSGAFTRAWPELGRSGNGSYLDLDNHYDEILSNMKEVYAEYTTGDNPVYPEGTVVHIGTDEYKGGNKENFRKYQDALLKYVRDDLGYTPRVWGSQTENSGTTPITVEGVQMNLWYSGYARPKDMYNLGYDLINTNDGDQYIVPGAGYYWDYLSRSHLYNSWEPNVIAGFKVPAGDEQMLGANFCVWNDKTGPLLDNGTTDVELFDRIYNIMPTYGTKLWGKNTYDLNKVVSISEQTTYAPNSNPTYQVESKGEAYLDYDFNNQNGADHSGNEYDLIKQNNVSYEDSIHWKALRLNGGESYVETPLSDIGLNTKIDFWVKKDETGYDDEQVLFESDLGSIKAVQKDTGKVGFTRWHRDYSFDYQLPENEWVHLTIVTEFTKTHLYVNGELVSTLERTAEHGNKWASLITPVNRIGSKTNAFKGLIDDVVITQKDTEADDTRLLKQAIDIAKEELSHTDWYTKQSLNHLQSIVDQAEELLKGTPSSTEVDSMIDTINEGISALKINKEGLEQLVEDSKQYQEKNYTTDSWKPFKDALEKAKDVLNNDTTPTDVQEAADQLKKAMDNLQLKEADYTKVDEAIKKANALNKDDYKDFSTVEKAIANVQRGLDITKQEEVDSYAKAIEEAIAKLVLKEADYTKVDEAIKKANALNK